MTRPGPRPAGPAAAGRVLVVDDEQSIRDAVATALGYEGLQVRTAATGAEALAAAERWAPDVVLLDIMLPDVDGIEVCRRLRQAGHDCHVVFLTARSLLATKVTGLESGGDDYVTKPFSLAELVARTRAVLRRRAMPPREAAGPAPDPHDLPAPPGVGEDDPEDRMLRCADLVLDPGGHQVWRGGTEVHLTATEFRLLGYFLRNQRRVLSKRQILDAVWEPGAEVTPNLVEAYVGTLRRKLDPLGPPLIGTVRLVGYVLRAPEDGPGGRRDEAGTGEEPAAAR